MKNEKEKQQTEQQQVKNAMAYIPVVPFVLYFTEEVKSPQFLKHIKYWMILFWIFIVLTIFFRSAFLWILFLAYIWVSSYLAYKAYIWEDVSFKFVDDFLEKQESKINKKDNWDLNIKEDENDVLK